MDRIKIFWNSFGFFCEIFGGILLWVLVVRFKRSVVLLMFDVLQDATGCLNSNPPHYREGTQSHLSVVKSREVLQFIISLQS